MRFPLRIKFAFAMVAVLFASIGLITFRATRLFIHDKSTYIYELNSVTARDRSLVIAENLEHLREKMRIFAKTYFAQFENKQAKEEILQSFFAQYQEFLTLSIYREDGLPPQHLFESQKLGTLNVSAASYEKYLVEMGFSVTDILEKRPFFVNATLDARIPAFALAVPLADIAGGKPVVAVGIIDLKQIEPNEDRKGIQEIFVTDYRGRIIFHSNNEHVIKRNNFSDSEIVRAMFANREHVLYGTKEYTAYDGQAVLAGFALIEPNQGGVVVQVPKTVATQGARELISKVLFISAVVLIVGIVLSLLFAGSVTKPLMELARATRRISKGEFNLRLRSRNRDEIGDLARDFNQMGEGLEERDQALEEAKQKLIQSEKMAAFGQLGAGIAHEVKNPLAGILGYVQLSRKKIPEDHPIAKNLGIVEKETKRCKEIIENLLKFARQEKVSFQLTNLNPVVRDAVALVEHQLTLNKVKIFRHFAQEDLWIQGNGNQLQQVLLNLMINAQHAMEPNGGELHVTTRAENGNGEIRIRDTGKGIPEEIRAKIFEPFFTTKPAGKGTGLGLSVTYGIIQDHKGEVVVLSEVGKGTEFVIRIPLTQAPQGKSAQDLSMSPAVSGDSAHA